MEVTNRFKGLDQIDCLKDYGTGCSDENHPQEKEMKNGCPRRPYKEKRKEVKGKGDKERYPSKHQVPKNSKEK